MSITPLFQRKTQPTIIRPIDPIRVDPVPGMREIAEHVKSTLGFDYVTLGVRTPRAADDTHWFGKDVL